MGRSLPGSSPGDGLPESPGVPWGQEAPALAGSGCIPGHQKPGLFWNQSPRGPALSLAWYTSRGVYFSEVTGRMPCSGPRARLCWEGASVEQAQGRLRPHGWDTEEPAGTGRGGERSEACGGFLEKGLKAEQGTRRGVGTEVSQMWEQQGPAGQGCWPGHDAS